MSKLGSYLRLLRYGLGDMRILVEASLDRAVSDEELERRFLAYLDKYDINPESRRARDAHRSILRDRKNHLSNQPPC